MAFCEFCKTEGQKSGQCACCGTVYYTAGVTFIYGLTEKDSHGCEFRLTNKYLIVRSVSNGEMIGNVSAGAAFGVIGMLAASAVDAARQKCYGFYDLQDLQKVIYPYCTNSMKKETAFKFVNKDGTDFILNFNLNGLFSAKAARGFAEALGKVGIYIENGAGIKHSVCCTNPFVNKETFGVRVCQSAATFVKMVNKQFVAPATSGSAPAQQPVAPQPVYQAPPVQPIQSVPIQPAVASVDTSAWQSAWGEAVTVPPVEENTEKNNMCSTCGAMNKDNARFCSKCGTPFQTSQESPVASAVDAWKDKW